MMELKQSPTSGLDFKDLKKENLNGVKPGSIIELDSNEMICLSDSENDVSAAAPSKPISTIVAEKLKSPPQFLTKSIKLIDALEKVNGDVNVDAQAILNDDITTKSTGKQGDAGDDIDIFAEEFLNEIIDDDKNGEDETVLDKELEDELLEEEVKESSLVEATEKAEKLNTNEVNKLEQGSGETKSEEEIAQPEETNAKLEEVQTDKMEECVEEEKEDEVKKNNVDKIANVHQIGNVESSEVEVSKNSVQDVPEKKTSLSTESEKGLELDDAESKKSKLAEESCGISSDSDQICVDAAIEADDASLKCDIESNKKTDLTPEDDKMLEEDKESLEDTTIPAAAVSNIEKDENESNTIQSEDVIMNDLEDVSANELESDVEESQDTKEPSIKNKDLKEKDESYFEELSQDIEMTDSNVPDEKSQKSSSDKNQDERTQNNDVDSLLSQISEAIEEKEEACDKTKEENSLGAEDIISLDSPMPGDEDMDEDAIVADSLLKDDKPEQPAIEKSTDSKKNEEKSSEDATKSIKDKTPEKSTNANASAFESDDDDVVLLDASIDEKSELDNEVEPKKAPQFIGKDERKVEIESDDDDIIVLPDKETTPEKAQDDDKKTENEAEALKETKTEKVKAGNENVDDDDVVLLDDDDKTEEDKEKAVENIVADEEEEEIFSINTGVTEITPSNTTADEFVALNEVAQSKKSETESKDDVADTTATVNAETSITIKKDGDDSVTDRNLVSDNSDNAQDKFPEDNNATTVRVEETNSDDGDNNLLEEAASPQNSRSHDQFDEDKAKQSETENSEISQEPPLKKSRIENDVKCKSEEVTTELEESTNDKIEIKEELEVEKKCVKRSLSPETSSQESKKIKVTGTVKLDSAKDVELLPIKKDAEPSIPAQKPFVKKMPKVDLNFDFLKRFKKSINKMTKSDLEELVLQKIVEAIVHRSEFSEMRDLIEKQEKMIATHRTKISEITKQFRDLEMVHSRVVKDLEQKNQQFIMPVKITRAVGLQVLIPKRSDHAASTAAAAATATPTASTSSIKPQPDRSLILNSTPSSTQTNASTSSTPATPVESQKRIRCNQKVTPLRPDTPQRSLLNNATKHSPVSTPTSTPTMPPLQQSTPQNKPIVYKTIIRNMVPQTSVAGQVTTQGHALQHNNSTLTHAPTTAQIFAATQAVRKSTTPRPSPQQQQPTVQKQQINVQQSPDRPRVPPMILKKATNGRSLTIANPQTAIAPQTTLQNQSAPQQAAASTNKSVIDLTDEDDKPTSSAPSLPALVAIPPQQQKPGPTAQNRITTYVISKPNSVPQRVTVTQNGTPRPPPKTTFIPIAPKPPTVTVAPSLTAINTSRLQVAAQGPLPVRRAAHPAPLPKPPHVVSNPSWKTPPPRPTIRINNIDTGIVISWTMDDMNDTNAEVTSYQIYAYQETSAPPQVEAWRHVGDVKAMLLPMAVTLTQFQEGQRYFFAVRAVDTHSRYGQFSMPKTWS